MYVDICSKNFANEAYFDHSNLYLLCSLVFWHARPQQAQDIRRDDAYVSSKATTQHFVKNDVLPTSSWNVDGTSRVL